MLTQLLESSPRRSRPHYSAIASIVGHAIALSGAMVAAHPLIEPDELATVITWHPPVPPPPQCADCGPSSRAAAQGRGRIPSHTLPPRPIGQFTVDVPESVDPPDEEIVISGQEWRRGSRAQHSGAAEPGVDRAIVDREVVPHPANPTPRYPAELRAAHIEGTVSARFVVDTTGRVVMETVTVDASTHPAFSDAVIDALRRSRFTPAEFRGRKVAQLVSQPFVFLLRE